MAFLDPARDLVVLRLVYDGAAFAGKTSSLASLAASLGRPLETSEEIAGRTLFFDWLDYEGGVFEGRRIRCQVVSVPGQESFARRRFQLLDSADVVVFVGDSSAARLAETVRRLGELGERLRQRPGPPVGIVFQANKRDFPEALSLDEIRLAIAGVDVEAALVESVATTGDGIRNAFVLGVRLALDRVRELKRLRLLEAQGPEADTSVELLGQIKAAELELEVLRDPGLDGPSTLDRQRHESAGRSPTRLLPTTSTSPEEAADLRPQPPGTAVPTGLVWPPVEGRIALHEARAPLAELEEVGAGEWRGRSPSGWLLHSPPDVFPGLEAARVALVEWSRAHSQYGALLSRERCLAAWAEPGGGWRLWQLVRQQPTLATAVGGALSEPGPMAAADGLLRVAVRLVLASQAFRQAGLALEAELRTVTAGGKQPQFVGLVPFRSPAKPPAIRARALLEQQLACRFGELAADAGEVAAALAAPPPSRPAWTAGIARDLRALLEAHQRRGSLAPEPGGW